MSSQRLPTDYYLLLFSNVTFFICLLLFSATTTTTTTTPPPPSSSKTIYFSDQYVKKSKQSKKDRKECSGRKRIECNERGNKIFLCHNQGGDDFRSICIREAKVRKWLRAHSRDYCGRCEDTDTTTTTPPSTTTTGTSSTTTTRGTSKDIFPSN